MSGVSLRKIHSKGKVSLGEYWPEYQTGNGDYVIVERGDGFVKLFPARVEKKPLCKK